MQLPLNFSETGESLRDKGTAKTLLRAGNTWAAEAKGLVVDFFFVSKEGTLEDAKLYAKRLGLINPPNPNCWGAVMLALSKAKVVERTGMMKKSTESQAHARMASVWRLA